MTRISILGAGAFGTALAAVYARASRSVTLWGRDAEAIHDMAKRRENRRRLPGLALPDSLHFTADLARAQEADILLIAVPAQATRAFVRQLEPGAPRVMVAKGIEIETGLLPYEIAGAVGVISGPGFAAELASGKPTALSLGVSGSEPGETLQAALSTETLRLYLTDDIRGVALGGALKNVYAIACGIVAGADLGESARAALLTRGFTEMVRLCTAMGARRETLMGLSGLGDLALSCTSAQSRNFAFGQQLGKGLGANLAGRTIEGAATARAVLRLAAREGVELPIADAVAEVLEGRLSIGSAVERLMSRPLRRES